MTEFSKASKTEWLAKAEKDLRGKAMNDLDFTVDGNTYSPFHHPEDLPTPPQPARGPRTAPCRSGISLPITDPAKDNIVILDLLNKGANALFLHSDTVDLAANLDQLLEGVYREFIHVYYLQGPANERIHSLQNEVFSSATTAVADAPYVERYARMLNDFSQTAATRPTSPVFWTEVDDDYLTSIARLRALRLCYRLVAEAYGITEACHIVADPFTTLDDKYGGMIATGANVSAAIIGGADTVFIPSGPTDDPQEKKFLRRVAVNTYNVLDHEAYLNRVADPAAGSYYLETLTDDIARTVWAAFQKLSAA